MTRRQKIALDFIKSFWAEHGYAPSYDELKDHMGLKSRSNVHAMVIRLVNRGFITMMPCRARSIMVVE